ncbi:MAG: ABC transporter permease subunit [Anaerolineae bacterium]|nr:ABC transporter permease subunit [Anaerolineae bacterium]
MSVDANSPSGGDVFVTTADLNARRAAPKPSPLAALVANGAVKRLLGLVYLIVIILLWEPLMTVFQKPERLARGEWLSPLVESLLLSFVLCLPLIVIALSSALRSQARTGTPFYRDTDFVRNAGEIVLLFLILQLGATLLSNLQANLSQSGLVIDFNVISRHFGVELTEGPDPRSSLDFLNQVPIFGESLSQIPALQPETVLRALAVGFINTLRVSVLALIATTFLGIVVGVGLLSRNWLLRNVATVFTEVFRNTPLLVQLFFLYNGVIKLLPPRPREAVTIIPDAVYVSGRGFYYPAVVSNESSSFFWAIFIVGVIVAVVLWRWRVRLNEQTGEPANALLYILGALAGFGLVAFAVAYLTGGFPFALDMPVVGNFNFTGGTSFSAEYLTLFLGLTLYTAAFIADIVRAGIQSVHKGQIEASRALGLNNGQTLNKIVLPQALRLAVPPLTNQYLNLVKNSSLGIAIGFLDLYNVGTIAYNQTGQAVAIFMLMALTYLIASLIISLMMNLFNNTLKLKTR